MSSGSSTSVDTDFRRHYNPAFRVEPQILTIVLLAVGVPASLLRLWLIWWRSACLDCGLEHRACVCRSDDHHTMRPRR